MRIFLINIKFFLIYNLKIKKFRKLILNNMEKVDFTKIEIDNLKQYVSDFNYYYENEDLVWNFNDLDDQRQIAFQIIKILENKFKSN